MLTFGLKTSEKKKCPLPCGRWLGLRAPSAINPPMLAGAGAELFDIILRMDGLGPFADEIKNCVEIPLGRRQLKVLGLERILASKIAANRPKDKLTIPVLRDALAATQAMKQRSKNK
jgi:hypothetical protein